MTALLLVLAACEPSEPRPPSEFEIAVKQLWRACESGDGKQCLELDAKLAGYETLQGKERQNALVLRRSYDTERLLRHACNAGEAVACYEKGKRTHTRGVSVDFIRGCELGHQPSCDEVARQKR